MQHNIPRTWLIPVIIGQQSGWTVCGVIIMQHVVDIFSKQQHTILPCQLYQWATSLYSVNLNNLYHINKSPHKTVKYTIKPLPHQTLCHSAKKICQHAATTNQHPHSVTVLRPHTSILILTSLQCLYWTFSSFTISGVWYLHTIPLSRVWYLHAITLSGMCYLHTITLSGVWYLHSHPQWGLLFTYYHAQWGELFTYSHRQWGLIFTYCHPQWGELFTYSHPQWGLIFAYYHPR